jgi:hypothetical protein
MGCKVGSSRFSRSFRSDDIHGCVYSAGKWREDDDKLTFIVLARFADRRRSTDNEEYLEQNTDTPDIAIDASPEDAGILALPMVGDVNLFLRGTVLVCECQAVRRIYRP